MWLFAKKLYHGWISTLTSLNEILWKLPPPEMKSWLRLCKNGCLIRVFFVERMTKCDLLILMTPLTNSQPGKLEGRCFDNKLPTYYILAYHKYVKSLNRLTWKRENLIIWLFCVNNKLIDQWSVSYDLKIFLANIKIKHLDNFQALKCHVIFKLGC